MKREPIKMWAGFVNDELDYQDVDDRFGGQHMSLRPALFRTRREAREQYCDVRKVEIREVKE